MSNGPGETAGGYVVPAAVMDCIYETLKFYANQCSYEGERTGGVLQGCPRGPTPTAEQLIAHAHHALKLINRDVLGRGETSAPECGHCDDRRQCSNQHGICSRFGGRPHSNKMSAQEQKP